MTKLILTESQYDRLSKFILETRFDVVVKDTIEVGDVVRITYKNTTNNFRVIQNDNGQVIMDNIDAGSALINYRYFMSFTGLNGNELDIKRVHKIKEKDKLKDKKTWTPIVVKNISNIEVLRNNKLIDVVDEPNSIQQDTKQTKNTHHNTPEDIHLLENIKDELLSLKEYHMLIFNLVDGTQIFFCAIAKNGLAYELEVSKIIGNSNKYENLRRNRIQMYFNESIEQDFLDDILIKGKGDKISLLLKIIEGENVSRFYLDFTSVKAGGTCEEEGATNDIEDDDKDEAREMMKTILNDPVLKKAFYKQPSLIDSIIATMKGQPAVGHGIGPALDIINKYVTDKIGKKLGESVKNFKLGKPVSFKLYTPTTIRYMLNARQQTQEFGIINPYKAIVKHGESSIELVSNEGGWKAIINSSVEGEEDTYLVDMVKFVTTKEGEIKTLGKQDNVKIRMIKSPGYTPYEKSTKL